MKRFILAMLFAAGAPVAMAQQNVVSKLDGAAAEQNIKDLRHMTGVSGGFRSYDNRYKGMKGTPFYWDSWGKATIHVGNSTFENVSAKYNVVDNELLYRNHEGENFIISANRIASFVLHDSLGLQAASFQRFPEVATVDPALAPQFLVALHDGPKVRFVLAPQKHIVKADFQGPYSPGREYDEFRNLPSYFLILGKDNVQKVNLSKRTLLKALPNHRDKMEAFIKERSLDLDTEHGWKAALAFYESL